MSRGKEAPKQIETVHCLVINRVYFMNEYHRNFGYIRVLAQLKNSVFSAD